MKKYLILFLVLSYATAFSQNNKAEKQNKPTELRQKNPEVVEYIVTENDKITSEKTKNPYIKEEDIINTMETTTEKKEKKPQ